MVRAIDSPEQFTIIGENIHATRVLLRKGRRVTILDDGTEAVGYKDGSGEISYLKVPESYKRTQPYEQGQIKHFMVAIQKGIGDDPAEQVEGRAYIHHGVHRQIPKGAHYLDLNVDEVSPNVEIQKKAMQWLVKTVQEISPLPPSVDSSNADIIEAGLSVYDRRAGRPLLNSLALERLETIEMVKRFDTKVIVTAAGASGMPQDDSERVENVKRVMEAVRSADIPLQDIHVDALVFPISVSPEYGLHYLDAVRDLRSTYGADVHITGGLSNVSFGLPSRKLINDTFIYLGLEAGIDSGIIDPVQSDMRRVFELDVHSEPVKLARDMLEGRDDYCVNYIQAWRDGRLK
jgi:5-methyltetrahydrofolate--homocysteine methyltransferase